MAAAGARHSKLRRAFYSYEIAATPAVLHDLDVAIDIRLQITTITVIHLYDV